MKNRRSRAEIREGMRWHANSTRSSADEMASQFDGCDDPLHPFMGFDPQPFRDWLDFHSRVVTPLVLNDDSDSPEVQEAMRLYRQANPHFIALCIFMAARSTALVEEP